METPRIDILKFNVADVQFPVFVLGAHGAGKSVLLKEIVKTRGDDPNLVVVDGEVVENPLLLRKPPRSDRWENSRPVRDALGKGELLVAATSMLFREPDACCLLGCVFVFAGNMSRAQLREVYRLYCLPPQPFDVKTFETIATTLSEAYTAIVIDNKRHAVTWYRAASPRPRDLRWFSRAIEKTT
uniref:Uncharacterized protein n=1 Tax=Marseillevirus LCMAC103 TaxID=2506604 RepID=A0A481YUS0_9VIRU|nr:MAG: hypothetical protein LCMAC103_02680 [Marseillevirus LCMAC103]